MKRTFLFIGFLFLMISGTFAQLLQPGFNKKEYRELLKLSGHNGDSAYISSLPQPEKFKMIYRSPVVGLDNRWDLWADDQQTVVISIRGTTLNSISWLANFYSAMVPAKGTLQLTETDTFAYDLAPNPRAAVHVGWLVSTAFLARDILPQIDSCYKAGIRNMLIMGHSQGGAIAFLMTSYLYNLQSRNIIPQDIRFKTYCSAGPKPGNTYYAYDYEALTANGWSYNVINSADWVPETPVSVQTVHDFNTTNPFINIKPIIKKQKFPNNVFVKYAYNRMYKPTRRAQRNYQKYLGKMVSRSIKQHIKGFQPPQYYPSINYARAGVTIVLQADDAYYQLFPDDTKNVFIHHLMQPYLYLSDKLKD